MLSPDAAARILSSLKVGSTLDERHIRAINAASYYISPKNAGNIKRNMMIVKLRKEGATFNSIADEMNISAGRARQIFLQHSQKEIQ